MKTLLAATTALSFIGANSLYAQTAPTMPVEIVTQDATDAGLEESHLLVPILFLIFIMATAGSAASGGDLAVTNVVAASDERLKTDIVRIDTAANGLPIYEFGYTGFDGRFRGVMAQDVLGHTPEAVITHPSGYMLVDYGLLGMQMVRIQ